MANFGRYRPVFNLHPTNFSTKIVPEIFFFENSKMLRDVLPKIGQNSPTFFGGENWVWYQNQNYLSTCTTCYINFGPVGKTRTSAAHSKFEPQNGDFDHLDKILSGSTGLRGKNCFYCGSICSRLVLIHMKKNFQNCSCFNVKKAKICLKSQSPKKQSSPNFPQFLMISPINKNKNGPDSEKISSHVFV